MTTLAPMFFLCGLTSGRGWPTVSLCWSTCTREKGCSCALMSLAAAANGMFYRIQIAHQLPPCGGSFLTA